ncbi:MAG: ankyrin repeat domain-containing protein [Wolbachia endosymbiont of Armadillidium vulgare]|nr:Ankyrin repeat [Wolbachia endosymbiont of Armadillidium vulgare]OJH32024.1 Ankyrin repeat [Wolbachia endosymbiont of Armadillidium vulgare]OJH32581.1 Ankyrin repeat [Wolbachia endosymbiont of Armadillidium vulgare]OJH33203.1 Ankyrin repeat [Wolbachia endosymbiont of Armadillidium vulgare]
MSGNSFDYKYYNSSILNQGEKARLARKTHKVGEIFLKHISNDVPGMSVDVLNIKDFGKEYNYAFERPNSIHARFKNDYDLDKDKVLIYSWPRYNEFDESKWNNFLSQLKESDYDLNFIGTGPLKFKYKGFNYSVYPPAFSFSQRETLFSPASNEVYTLLEAKISSDYKDYESFAFSFSQEEANEIIENIKRSHQSIKKKIIDHYQSLGKDFVKNDSDYIAIGTDINNKTRLSSVIYFNERNGIDEVKLELYKATPLHLFAKYSLSQQLEDRLDKGTDVNAMDESEKTPLHYAAEMGHVKIVQILLGKGADVNAKDEDGNTPFDLASAEEIKALLKKAAEKTDDSSVSTDNEVGQEEDVGQEGNAQLSLQEQKEEPQEISAEEGNDVKIEAADNGHPTDKALNMPKQNSVSPQSESSISEEQPSSFFGNLFSILMKPFSLIGSFFGGFFSWLFGSDEPPTVLEQLSNSGGEELANYQENSDDII